MTVRASHPALNVSAIRSFDLQARKTTKTVQRSIKPVVVGQVPRRTGQLGLDLQPRLRSTKSGASVVVTTTRGKRHNPSGATTAQVSRWVQRGTGVHGYQGKAYRAKPPNIAMRVYGRRVFSVEGQDPNPFMRRIQTIGTLRFERAAIAGGAEALRLVTGQLGG